MGEIAEMMLEGILCECCGAALERNLKGEPPGHPDYCSEQCARDRGADWWLEAHTTKGKQINKRGAKKPFPCSSCKKRFGSEYSLKQHQKDTGHV